MGVGPQWVWIVSVAMLGLLWLSISQVSGSICHAQSVMS